jgi:predicted RNA-binding Zn-ribbon protein involved in translation (DUF1610 family)
MTSCKHSNLVLLPEQKSKQRCRHCHLTIKADELAGGYCPECFEAHGKKRYDFEEIVQAEAGMTRYRCEKCGIMIENG